MDQTIRQFWRAWPQEYRDCMWEGQNLFEHSCGLFKFFPHKYGSLYDAILSPYQNAPIQFTEIGVSGGWSMLLWDQYYTHPDARFIGIDPLYDLRREDDDPESQKTRDRVSMFESTTSPLFTDRVDVRFNDAYTWTTVSTLENLSQDIIIDDGTHAVEDKLYMIREYWRKVKYGGWMIIEDFHASRDVGLLEAVYDTDYRDIYIYSGHPTHELFRNFPNAEEGIIAIQKAHP